MPSPRYRLLQRRLTDLRRNLLPQRFDPTGTYSPRVHDRARGYRLLVHAEFEAFLEDRVVDVAHTAFDSWRITGKPRRPIVGMLAYSPTERGDPDSLLKPPQTPGPDLIRRVELAKNWLTRQARVENHGVKERNVLRLLMPLGIREQELDVAWLASLDAWAVGRGDWAHQPAMKLTVLPDPKDELTTARRLAEGFKSLDRLLDSL